MKTPSAPPLPDTFWARQFAPRVTAGQVLFDVAAGVVLPVVCLVADPLVFRSESFGGPVLGRYAVSAYLCIGVEIFCLCGWLLCRQPPGLLAGVLGAGALFSFGLGLVLLPLSLLGLLAGVGILGLSPFATCFVYLRNCVRALARAEQGGGRAWGLLAACGFLAALAGPLFAQDYLKREVDRAVAGTLSAEPGSEPESIRRLRWLATRADLDPLVRAYAQEEGEARRRRLREVYRELTGSDIERRLAVLND